MDSVCFDERAGLQILKKYLRNLQARVEALRPPQVYQHVDLMSERDDLWSAHKRTATPDCR